jgi:hypothetical protein
MANSSAGVEPADTKKFSELEQRCIDLEKRLAKTESYFKIAVTVAAIFGISGGYGASILRSASTDIQKVQTDIVTVQKDINDSKSATAILKKDILKTTGDFPAITERELAKLEREAPKRVKESLDRQVRETVQPTLDRLDARITEVGFYTSYIYGVAKAYGMPQHEGANGHWQKKIIDLADQTEKQLGKAYK